MTVPMIHMNGTSKTDLLDGYCAVHSAIENAIETMAKHGPNARDYYTSADPMAFTSARIEHTQRLSALRAIKEDVGALLTAISEQ